MTAFPPVKSRPGPTRRRLYVALFLLAALASFRVLGCPGDELHRAVAESAAPDALTSDERMVLPEFQPHAADPLVLPPPDVAQPELLDATAATAEPRGQLRVWVTWSDGRAASAVPVRLSSEGTGAGLMLSEIRPTDGEGLVTWERLAPGSWCVKVSRDHLEVVRLHGPDVLDVSVTLPVGVRIAGTVVDEESGAPVRGASIHCFRPYHVPSTGVVARSDESGTFEIEGVQPGEALHADAPLLTSANVVRIAALPDETVKVVLRTRPGGGLRGRVLTEDGTPVSKAAVIADGDGFWPPEGVEAASVLREFPEQVALTAADGSFALGGLAPGRHRIFARVPGFQVGPRLAVTVRAGEWAESDLVLARACEVFGRVLTVSGQAASGSISHVAQVPAHERVSTNTSDSGHYRLTELPCGVQELQCSTAAGLVRTVVELTPGVPVEWNPVVGAGGRLELRVIERDTGRACIGWSLLVKEGGPQEQNGRFFTTDASGRATVILSESRAESIAAYLPGYPFGIPQAVHGPIVVEGSLQLDLIVPGESAAGRLRGRVLGGEWLAALARPEVRVRAPGRMGGRSTPVSESGLFELAGLPAGVHVFEVRSGQAQLHQSQLTIEEGQLHDLGTLFLKPLGTLSLWAALQPQDRFLVIEVQGLDGQGFAVARLHHEQPEAELQLPEQQYTLRMTTHREDVGWESSVTVRSGSVVRWQVPPRPR